MEGRGGLCWGCGGSMIVIEVVTLCGICGPGGRLEIAAFSWAIAQVSRSFFFFRERSNETPAKLAVAGPLTAGTGQP